MCVLMKEGPYPKGRQRIIPILQGVSEEDFKKANPEFSSYVSVVIFTYSLLSISHFFSIPYINNDVS